MPKKPLSPRQLAANRANAQKSTGPTTPEGKQRARINSLKHGLTAREVCVPGESREEYDQRRQEYIDYFQPANLIEWDLLDDLVAARWRKQRIMRYEKCLILESFLARRQDVASNYSDITLDSEAALAFRQLGQDSGFLNKLDRYESRITRNISTAYNQLRDAIDNRPPHAGPVNPSTPEWQNGPIPEIEHSQPPPDPPPS